MFSFLVKRFPNGALLGVVAVVDAGDRLVEHVDFSPAGMDIGAKEIDRWHKPLLTPTHQDSAYKS